MQLTHANVNDLLARLVPGNGPLYLPDCLDRQELTDLLADRYGTPRTLVLDGFVDPTADESRGAALLLPFEGRAVTIRAWAYGDQWIGTGTARDAEGAERSVLVAAPRAIPAALPEAARDTGVGEHETVDWLERLKHITGWTQPDRRPGLDWAETESRLGTALPADYRRLVETFGKGGFDGFLDLNQEPWTTLREDGLLVWAGTEHENLYCWRTDGDDPDRWPVVVRSSDGEDVPFDCRATEFVCRVLVEPHHPFSMARFFDTHWFMTYGEGV
ncbi:SMI1/KNR4 family protein [Streptomyces sp. NPDC056144]|uniref:SMI1/KNR4 family protein n=1 Tax=unclassified Streptomyces TaxID=2593676 RepID=UPI0035DDFFF5